MSENMSEYHVIRNTYQRVNQYRNAHARGVYGDYFSCGMVRNWVAELTRNRDICRRNEGYGFLYIMTGQKILVQV